VRGRYVPATHRTPLEWPISRQSAYPRGTVAGPGAVGPRQEETYQPPQPDRSALPPDCPRHRVRPAHRRHPRQRLHGDGAAPVGACSAPGRRATRGGHARNHDLRPGIGRAQSVGRCEPVREPRPGSRAGHGRCGTDARNTRWRTGRHRWGRPRGPDHADGPVGADRDDAGHDRSDGPTSRADRGTDRSTDSGADPSTDGCADTRADPSTDGSTHSGADRGADPGPAPASATDAGTHPGARRMPRSTDPAAGLPLTF
jgi:hypothetical protein